MTQWPHFEEDEIQAVVDVLKSGKPNYWGGSQIKAFEQEFAKYHSCQYGVAVANGTVALELALYALGIGSGDDVITTSKTFLASASAIVMRGARPIIADIDLDSQNITVDTIKAVMTPKTKAIIAVHLAGWPCEMDKIMAFAKEHHLFVIEDCAQAHGARYKGKSVGSWGDMAAFSFCQDKIMTTGGEGGLVTTNDETLWKRAWSFKDHGKDYDSVFNTEHPPGFRWLHADFGTNWRMTEMQAAIGRQQLKKLPDWLAKRRRNAAILSEIFKDISFLRVTTPPKEVEHAYYKYYVFVELAEGVARDKVIECLANHHLPAMSGSCSEIYNEQCFKALGLGPDKYHKNAKQLTETSLMFLVHPTLSEKEMRDTAHKIKNVLLTCVNEVA